MTAPLESPLHRVRVPASTSNLGPGFDLLGLALSMYVDVSLSPIDGGAHELRRSGSIRDELGKGEHADGDLVVRAFERAARDADVRGNFRFDVSSSVPVARGFGSSGAAVAAGLLLANAVARAPLPLDALLAIGVELEGHPDNITASLFGGCTLCHPSPEQSDARALPVWIHNDVHASIGFALAWSASPLSTDDARRALPRTVAFEDAVENPRRLALLLEGLRTGDARLLSLGGEERLHVRHRLALIDGAPDALDAARTAGAWLATISGAGSGLVALGPLDGIDRIADAMRAAFVRSTGRGHALVARPVFGTPRVEATDQSGA